jgi:Amt family ammonium transporter
MSAPAPYYPNYGYVGSPANYNGTGKNGGDSGMMSFCTSLMLLLPHSIISSRCTPKLMSKFPTAVENLNQWFDPGDQAYIIVSSCMVLLMIPGLGFLYSGLARRKSALSMIWACMASFSIIVFQWYFWGYSLAFSPSATNGFIGDLQHFGLMNTLGTPSPGSPLIPELLYSFYQVSFGG